MCIRTGEKSCPGMPEGKISPHNSWAAYVSVAVCPNHICFRIYQHWIQFRLSSTGSMVLFGATCFSHTPCGSWQVADVAGEAVKHPDGLIWLDCHSWLFEIMTYEMTAIFSNHVPRTVYFYPWSSNPELGSCCGWYMLICWSRDPMLIGTRLVPRCCILSGLSGSSHSWQQARGLGSVISRLRPTQQGGYWNLLDLRAHPSLGCPKCWLFSQWFADSPHQRFGLV